MISVECFRSGRSPLPAARTVEGQGVCVVVRDANEQALGYLYFEEETGPAIGGRRRWGIIEPCLPSPGKAPPSLLDEPGT